MKTYDVIYKERGKGKELQTLRIESESATKAIEDGRAQLGEGYSVRRVKLVREEAESDATE